MNLSKGMIFMVSLALLFGAKNLLAQTSKTGRKPAESIMALDDYVPRSAVIFEGKWKPIHGKSDAGGSIVWIRCDVREKECIELDARPVANSTMLWQTSYKIKSWDGNEIVARGSSLDGCTSQTLIANVNKGSIKAVRSPATPLPKRCAHMDSAWEKLGMSRKELLKGQTEQDRLVPTRLPGLGDAPPALPKRAKAK